MVIKRILVMSVVLVMIAGSFSSCAKNEDSSKCKDANNQCMCNVNYPLTDLPWLKEWVDRAKKRPGLLTEIYLCNYNDGIDGFLIKPCINCQDPFAFLYSCEGTFLYDFQTPESWVAFAKEWNIKNLELIWKNF